MGEAELGEADSELGRLEAAILSDPIRSLQLEEPALVDESATLQHAVETLQRRHVGCVLVTGAGGKLAGIFTERDLLTRVAGRRLDWAACRVGDYMTAGPETLRPEDRIAWALNLMHLGGYRHVPLTDAEGRPIGVVSVKNVVGFIVDLFPAYVLNLPPDLHRLPSSETEGGGED